MWFLFILAFFSCQKELSSDLVQIVTKPSPTDIIDSVANSNNVMAAKKGFVTYTILKGQQYCVGNIYPPYITTNMHFIVRFDSSNIYTNQIATNQFDYNKLYGFSDNKSDHHSFSARFGWRWCHNQIELSAYTYNNGIRSIKDLGGVALNKDHDCSIIVSGSNYAFVLDGDTTLVSRTSKTPQAVGYKLLPYFGGDEMAPHTMYIQIKDLP